MSPATVTEALETRARQIAADKMGLIKDPTGAKLPEDLWWQTLPQAQAELAAVRSDVTTRLAEAEDRAAKAEARAERVERDCACLMDENAYVGKRFAELTARAEKAEAEAADYDEMRDGMNMWRDRAIAAEAQVAELTRKLDEGRSVLRRPLVERLTHDDLW